MDGDGFELTECCLGGGMICLGRGTIIRDASNQPPSYPHVPVIIFQLKGHWGSDAITKTYTAYFLFLFIIYIPYFHVRSLLNEM